MSAPAPASGSGWRRARRALLLAVLLLAALLSIAAWWLLRSGGGRDFALARALATLPAESLRWERAEGSLQGPLVLHGLRFAQDGLLIEAERASIDLAPAAALSRAIRVESLALRNVRVQLPPADPAAPRWPAQLRLPARLPELALPYALRIDALRVEALRVERDGTQLLEVALLEAAGGVADGTLQVDRLDARTDRGRWTLHGALDTRRHWHGELLLDGALPIAGAAPLPLRLHYRGAPDAVTFELVAGLEPAADAQLRLVGGLPSPRWLGHLRAPRFDPARFGRAGAPLAVELSFDGDLQQVELRGRVSRADQHYLLQPSVLRYADTTLQLAPLVLETPQGTLRAEGSIALAAPAPVYDLALASEDWHWSPAPDQPEVRAGFRATLQGPGHDYALRLDGQLSRAGQHATLALAGHGDAGALRLERFGLATAQGSLQGRGTLGWDPQPHWDLDARLHDFDPSWWLGALPGAIDGQLRSAGRLGEHGSGWNLAVTELGGTLRGRALRGTARAEVGPGEQGSAALDLGLGQSRLHGEARWSESVEASLQLAPLQLADFVPDAAGTLQGRIGVRGSRAMPALEARLDGRALAAFGGAAQALRLRAGRDGDGEADIELELDQPSWGGQRFTTLRLDAEGRAESHRASLALRGDAVALELALRGGGDRQRWQGTLDALRVAPRERAAWTLQAPAALSWDRAQDAWSLARSCLRDGAAALCARLGHAAGRSEAEATLEGFALATLDPFLAAHFELPLVAHGVLAGRARFERSADRPWQGRLTLASEAGGLRLDPAAPRELFAYRDFRLDAALDPAQATLEAAAVVGADGRAELALRSDAPQAADGALEGRLTLALRDLGFLELGSERLVAPKGRVDAALAIGGTRRAPTLQGQATLAGFTAEVPELGLTLREGGLRLRSQGTRVATLEGELASGGGQLRVSGRLDLREQAEAWLDLRLQGSDFAAAALPELGAVVAPDLTLVRRRDRWILGGKLEVPSANINLEKLEAATRPSSDVVVVDEERSERAAGEVLYEGDVDLVLGDKVRLQGFGLKGRLEGRLAVRERPGRATVARGALQVSGEYKAYGQDLEITRGRLAYASTPLDDPALDIRAEREIDPATTVGVQVRGTARQPELTLWSEPALDQAEQLSYLVLGRPMRSATQADGARLSQAAAAFGGNLLAQKLGARMGLDEVGVSDSQALGGAALTVGKYLSPRLYVSYGVALFGSGQVVTFRYLLSRLWSVQIDSGSENRAALNYRLER